MLGGIKITYKIGDCAITRTHRPVRIGKSPTTLMDVGLTIAELVLDEPPLNPQPTLIIINRNNTLPLLIKGCSTTSPNGVE